MGELSSTQFLLAYTIGTVAGILVWFHADRRGSKHATAWATCTFLFFAIALPAYLIHVRRTRNRT